MTSIKDIINNHSIVIFSKTYCPYCIKVKELFNELGRDYHVLELDGMGEEGERLQSELFRLTTQKTVPNVFINGLHVGGFDRVSELHTSGKLNSLLDNKFDYDLVVIGGGSGGLAASKEAAKLGKKVAVLDFVKPSPLGTTWGLGGTCVNVGCIPKKIMHHASLVGEKVKHSQIYGWELPHGEVNHNWEKMVSATQDFIKSLNFGYRKILRQNRVNYINAYAEFTKPGNPHLLTVTDKKSKSYDIMAKDILIAVGGRPKYPDIPGAKEFAITSDDLFSLPHRPGKTLIVGASYIALECAGFLSGLGFEVTVMVRSILLRGFDQQVAEMIGSHMESHNIHFVKECIPTSLKKVEGGKPGKIEVEGNFKDGSVWKGHFNTVLFAIGRDPCTHSMGLEKVGIKLNPQNGKIVCDNYDQTSVENIYAVGDVSDGKPELTPVAIQAGRNLVQRLYTKGGQLTDYSVVPTTVFTPLEYGCVGLSEENAISAYGETNIEVYHTHFQPLEYELPNCDRMVSYAKLICVKSEEERVVGFHYLGPNAGEITQGFSLGLALGAKKTDFSRLIGIHPTCAEVFTSLDITKGSGVSVEKTAC